MIDDLEKIKKAIEFIKKHAVFPLGIVYDMRPGSPWDVVIEAEALTKLLIAECKK
jgi:hypothetical protein